METKRNLKYFIAPPLSIPSLIGWAITVIGIILIIAKLTLPGLLVTIVGIAVVAVTSGGKSTDTDIEFQISERIKDLQEQSEKHFEVYEKNFLKMLKPVNLRGYDFIEKETPFYFKKGSDGMNRTNYFTGMNLIFTNEKMFVYGRRFSLINEEIDEKITSSFYFTELDKVVLDEKSYTTTIKKHEEQVPYYVFRVLKTDGEDAVALCVDYGADIDKYVEQISRAIVTRKKELEKRAEETAQRRAEFRARIEAEKEEIARGERYEDE